MRDFIAKIEGHGNLTVNWRKNKVKLNIHEGERLFEGLLVGRKAEEAYWITPRICGVCPIAHSIASLSAIESANKIKINQTTELLRRLMLCAQMIQSHTLHLFFLALPDYLGIDSGLELAKKNSQSFKKALALKKLSDETAEIVGGRSLHPVTLTAGGFYKIPTKNNLQKLFNQFKKSDKIAKWVPDFFSVLKYPVLKVDLEFLSLEKNQIISSKYGKTDIIDYKKSIQEEVKNYSSAKFSKFNNREVMVGALARLNISKNIYKYKINFTNPFHNNFAQAIEIFQFHQEAREIIQKLLDLEMDSTISQPVKNSLLKGIGAVEAPRGGLYHEIHLDKNNIITYANIITPTVQNLTSIEKSAEALLEQYKNKSQQQKIQLLNILIRAYDPCITCAVH